MLPTNVFNEAGERILRHLSDGPERESFIGACKGVVFRHRAAEEYDKTFDCALNGPGNAEGLCEQEKALFGFFTSALASIDSFYFGTYFAGWLAQPESFTVVSQPKKITVSRTAYSFKCGLPGDRFTSALNNVPLHVQYQKLCDIRNTLAHRVVPNRIRYLAVHVGASADPSVFNDRPDTWKLPQSPSVDAHLTAAPLGWLSEALTMLIRELWDFTERTF
jgi:hypothetical protein